MRERHVCIEIFDFVMHTFVLFADAGDPPAPYRQPKAENTSMISLEAGERGMRHPAEN